LRLCLQIAFYFYVGNAGKGEVVKREWDRGKCHVVGIVVVVRYIGCPLTQFIHLFRREQSRREVARFDVFSYTNDVLTCPSPKERRVIIVDIISTDSPEVSTRKTEANDVFDGFDMSKDKSMQFHRKVGKVDGRVDVGLVVAAFGFCPLVALSGTGQHFAVGFTLRAFVHPDLMRVASGHVGDTTVALRPA
jgi:hypothetical protein